MINPGMTCFKIEGYSSIKVTPLGENLCLSEEVEEGMIEVVIRKGCSWWKQWFHEIQLWKEEDVNNDRVTWIRA